MSRRLPDFPLPFPSNRKSKIANRKSFHPSLHQSNTPALRLIRMLPLGPNCYGWERQCYAWEVQQAPDFIDLLRCYAWESDFWEGSGGRFNVTESLRPSNVPSLSSSLTSSSSLACTREIPVASQSNLLRHLSLLLRTISASLLPGEKVKVAATSPRSK